MGNAKDNGTTDAGGGVVAVRSDDGDVRRDVALDRGAVSEGAAILSMIERAARDPAVDINKMERLFEMQQQAAARRAKTAYISALSDMQPELPIVNKRGEISRKAKDDAGVKQSAKPTKFAKWEDVVEAIAPILAKHGFSLSFRIEQDARVKVTAVLGHREGHCEETSMSLGIDDSGAKNNIQGWGSSVSYGKRYTAFAILNIVARDEDDDGKAAGHVPADAPTVDKLKALIVDTNADTGWICSHYSVESLDDLTAKQITDAMAGLAARKRKQVQK